MMSRLLDPAERAHPGAQRAVRRSQGQQRFVLADEHVGARRPGQFEEFLVVRVAAGRQRRQHVPGRLAGPGEGVVCVEDAAGFMPGDSELRVAQHVSQLAAAGGADETGGAALVQGAPDRRHGGVFEVQQIQHDVGVEY
jgi:hypothetical protein